jgi:hypothetical protein
MRKFVYVQFASQGKNADGREISMEPVRWRSVLLGTLSIAGYDSSGFRDQIWAADISHEDPRSLNLEVDGRTSLDELKRHLPGAVLIGEFTPPKKMVPLMPLPVKSARIIRDPRLGAAVA